LAMPRDAGCKPAATNREFTRAVVLTTAPSAGAKADGGRCRRRRRR
jgi:hypothetical protein